MRRSEAIVPFVILAAACISLAALLLLPGVSSAEGPSQDTPSQGSIVKGPGLPEENFPDYSRVVDNSSERFDAPGWKSGSSGLNLYGEDYSFAGSGENAEPARFKVQIPATDVYSVYAWWTAEDSSDSSARFGISTPSGVKWTEVDQTTDGGFWVKIGQFEIEKGDHYAVQIAPGSKGEGYAVADAVSVVRGVTSAPPESSYDGNSSTLLTTSARRGGNSGPDGRDVIRKARKFMGTRYKYATCTRTLMSCTCLTKRTYGGFRVSMNMSESAQWTSKRGHYVKNRSNLRRGDHVFFKESGRSGPVTHVGVYAGNGNLVHASAYFGKVVEGKMKYIKGYHGAKRYAYKR